MAATAAPRSLNVQQLAEARRTEIQSLHTLVSTRLAASFRLPRSLRRRTTSHLRRCKRRRSSEKEEGEEVEEEEDEENPKRKRRLQTHVWHAKRFEMAERWGFWLPLGIQGRGRGAGALLEKLSEALVHDASYYLPLLLEGPQASALCLCLYASMPLLFISLITFSFSFSFCLGFSSLSLDHGSPSLPSSSPSCTICFSSSCLGK